MATVSIQNTKPKAFISCSLREEDKPFTDFVTKITERMGFQPFGTVGLYSVSPEPIWKQMDVNIKKADCMILIATPRYISVDIHDKEKTGKSISESLHVEFGMAVSSKCPILVFVEKGTDVGNLIPSAVQFIELDINNKDDLDNKSPLIANYFRSALTIIQKKWNEEKKSNIWGIVKAALMIIGGAKVLSSIFKDDDYY